MINFKTHEDEGPKCPTNYSEEKTMTNFKTHEEITPYLPALQDNDLYRLMEAESLLTADHKVQCMKVKEYAENFSDVPRARALAHKMLDDFEAGKPVTARIESGYYLAEDGNADAWIKVLREMRIKTFLLDYRSDRASIMLRAFKKAGARIIDICLTEFRTYDGRPEPPTFVMEID